MKIKNSAGFTLVEIIIVIAILAILMAIIIPNFFSINKNSDLNNGATEFSTILKLAQNKTLSSEDYSQYGIYLDTTTSPHKYVLFKGQSYVSRDPSFNQSYSLPDTMEFYNINLQGGGNQIVFDRLTGASNNHGNVSIRLKIDTTKNKTIYVANSGSVGFIPPVTILDASRINDSRHLHFAYSRIIDTANENLVLTFDNSQTEIIQISFYLVGGELQWEGTVNIGGNDQKIEINTHKLNSPNTLFSVRRDRRYNDKILKITLSGDSSGYLAQYSADGSDITHTSTYVSDFLLQ